MLLNQRFENSNATRLDTAWCICSNPHIIPFFQRNRAAATRNTWQEIWGGVANRDQINSFIDMADAISNVVSEVGLLNTAVGVLGGALSVKSGVGRGKAISLPSLNMPTVCWW